MIHIESHSEEFHSIRFYPDLIISQKLDDLPEYIGVGHLKINNGIGFVSAVCFKDKNSLTKKHINKIGYLLKGLGCSSLEFDRHKNNQIKRYTIKL